MTDPITDLIKGNEAIAMGAIAAGCRFYFGYPITPQNDIPEYMSRHLPLVGGTFIQAESEIASINMLLGAGATGARAMTSSSSPGISLKQEGISYMAGSEIPGVIVNMSRSGPGLGGISPSQGDYFQCHPGWWTRRLPDAGLYPFSAQENYDLAMAFRSGRPVPQPGGDPGECLTGTDQGTGHLAPLPAQRISQALGRDRGRGPQSPVSEKPLPDRGGVTVHNWNLFQKYQRMKAEIEFQTYLIEDADLVVVSFGSVARIISPPSIWPEEKG